MKAPPVARYALTETRTVVHGALSGTRPRVPSSRRQPRRCTRARESRSETDGASSPASPAPGSIHGAPPASSPAPGPSDVRSCCRTRIVDCVLSL